VPGTTTAFGETEWAGRRVAFGMTVSADRCRLLLDGNVTKKAKELQAQRRRAASVLMAALTDDKKRKLVLSLPSEQQIHERYVAVISGELK